MSKVPKNIYLAVSALMVFSMVLAACAGPTATATPALPQTGSTQQPTQPAAQPTGAATTAPTQSSATSAPTQPAATTAPTSAPTQVKNPDTITYATIGDPESLDPSWAYDTASGTVIFNVYETLLFLKKDSTTEFVPMLATSWDISSDGLTYTFHILRG